MRIKNLEQHFDCVNADIGGLNSRMVDGFNGVGQKIEKLDGKLDSWVRWIVEFGVGTVLFKVSYYDATVRNMVMTEIEKPKGEMLSTMRGLFENSATRVGSEIKAVNNDIMLAVREERYNNKAKKGLYPL